jgi:Flp pilus assembly protein TadG
MKPKRLTPRKSKAQALVEFAIVLPLLMLLLYGLLEAGRILFLYSTVVTASRQAARYGSASGVGNGTGNASEPRYQDCDGIRGAAQRVAFLGPFDTVAIAWDGGPATSPTTYCANTSAQTDNSFAPAGNNTRITVTVTEPFTPIIPLIVPITPRDVTARSSRTILLSVSIEVTPTGGPTATYTPTNTPTPSATASPSSTPTITETLLYTYTPSQIPPTLPPTLTPSPAATMTPSLIPSPTLTRVPSCNNVTHSFSLTKSGNSLIVTITNNHNFPIIIQDLTLTWNDDKGHQTGSDKSLILQSASLGGAVFWTGNVDNQSIYTIVASPVIPPNQSVTLTFTFHQSYDNLDGTEDLYINLFTPGCEGNPIHI